MLYNPAIKRANMYKYMINWRELSKELTGSPTTIRSNKIPKANKEAIDELHILIEYWKHKHSRGK